MAICAMALTGCDASAGFVGGARHIANQTGADLNQAGTHVGNAVGEVGRAGGAVIGGAGRAAGDLANAGGAVIGSAGRAVAPAHRSGPVTSGVTGMANNIAVLHEFRFDTAHRTVYVRVHPGTTNAYTGAPGGGAVGGALATGRAPHATAISSSHPWHMTIPLGWRVMLQESRGGSAHIVSYGSSNAAGAGLAHRAGNVRTLAGMRAGSYAVVSNADVLGHIAVVRTQNPYISF